MALSTYSELQAAISDWLNRGDLAAAIPTFISFAEAEINRTLRTRDMVKRATATLDGRFLALPPDCAEMKNARLDGEAYGLKVKTSEQLDELRPRFPVPGKPLFYAVLGNALEALPVPAQAYTVELSYYERIKALSDADASNWLLLKHPDLYLFGALMQSAPYLKDDARVQLWVDAHDRVLTQIRAEEDHAVYAGSTPAVRVRPIG